jgi:uncharacterized protein (DUF2236 family)
MTTVAAPRLGHLDPAARLDLDRRGMLRRMAAEPVLALILQRALVLEVAHPKIGAAVEDHSAFRGRPYRRVWATLDVAVRIVWGDEATAREAAAQVYRFHDHVNGALPDGSADWPAGAPYTAHDATLLLWVWATLVDTMRCGYERWVAPLSDTEADAFYADMVGFARFFGIAADLVPPDRRAFAAYYESVLDSDTLAPTPTSVAMVHDVLWFRHWNVPAPAVRALRALSIGVLDARVVDRYHLALEPRDGALFERLDRGLCRWYRHRPAWLLRRLPEAYVLARRPMLAAARRRRQARGPTSA